MRPFVPFTGHISYPSYARNAHNNHTEISEKNLNMEYVKSGIYFPRGRDIDGKRLLVARLRLHIRGLRDLDELLRVFVYWLERLWR